MRNFNTTRFGHVLKLDFVEGLKPILWGMLCMLLLYLFFFWFAHNVGMKESRFQYMSESVVNIQEYRVKSICEAVGASSMVGSLIFCLVAASTLYRDEQKKQKRISRLMLPASNLEKFTSRLVYLVVFCVTGGLLPFLVADLMHMGYLWIADMPVMNATSYFFYYFPHENTWLSNIDVALLLITFLTFFILGGVFFKRYHFIATGAVVAIILSICAASLNYIGYRETPDSLANTSEPYLSIAFSVCLIIPFVWLAYRLFCRWQVVTHKFANV